MTAGVPSQSLEPKSITTVRSTRPMTKSMSCSTSNMVSPSDLSAPRSRAREKAGCRARIGPEQDRVEKCHVRAQLHMLEGARDAGAGDQALLPPGNFSTQKRDAALIRREGAGDQVEH